MTDVRRELAGLKNEIGIEDEMIKECIALLIELANKYIDFKKVKRKYGVDEDRTLLLRIVDVPGECGFIIDGDKIRPLRGIERATVEVEMTKDVFWALVTRKLDLYTAWLYDLVKFKGENALRDAQILIDMFETLYPYIYEKLEE